MAEPEGFIATDSIDGVWPFLQSIEWKDPWLAILLTFHIAVTTTALMTRNHANFQILLFLILLLLVYFSESINEAAATNWMVFSRQQYFDSKGLFISIVFSVPILMNCMIMVASWLYQSSQLMTSLKRAQLRERTRNRRGEASAAGIMATISGSVTHLGTLGCSFYCPVLGIWKSKARGSLSVPADCKKVKRVRF